MPIPQRIEPDGVLTPIAVSGLAIPLVGLAVALASPANAASCIESTTGCRSVMVHHMTHDQPSGIYSGDVICRPGTLC